MVSSSSVTQLVDWLGVDEVVADELPPSWNVAPGRELYVVAGTRAGTRRMGVMRWGLVPSWSTDPSSGPRPINARAESLLDRPAFAGLVGRRRCLVPVDGSTSGGASRAAGSRGSWRRREEVPSCWPACGTGGCRPPATRW